MENLVANAATWCIFMSVTLRVAVHSGTDYTENLRSTRNQSKKSLRQLFQVTRKLITDQTEMTGITTTEWQQLMWRETTLLSDKAVQFATEKNPASSLTQCCVWEAPVQNQKTQGKVRSNGLWNHVLSKIWIESTENKLNSSVKVSQDLLRCRSSTRFKR